MIKNVVTSNKNRRFADLAKFGQTLFHIDDLSNLWGIENVNTLRKTLSRYALAGLIFRIYRGFYSLKDPREVDPKLLGLKALHSTAYISCESVLFENGIVNQPPREITIVSRASRRYIVGNFQFRSRRLADKFLHNNAGIETRAGVRVATVERAVIDMLYFNPRAYFDAYASSLIDWKKVHELSIQIGYRVKIPV